MWRKNIYIKYLLGEINSSFEADGGFPPLLRVNFLAPVLGDQYMCYAWLQALFLWRLDSLLARKNVMSEHEVFPSVNTGIICR